MSMNTLVGVLIEAGVVVSAARDRIGGRVVGSISSVGIGAVICCV